jgi:hypothetical protein
MNDSRKSNNSRRGSGAAERQPFPCNVKVRKGHSLIERFEFKYCGHDLTNIADAERKLGMIGFFER